MQKMIYGVSVTFEEARDLFSGWRSSDDIQKPSDFNGRTSNANGLVFCCLNEEQVAIGVFVPPDPYAMPAIPKHKLCEKLGASDKEFEVWLLGEEI